MGRSRHHGNKSYDGIVAVDSVGWAAPTKEEDDQVQDRMSNLQVRDALYCL